MALEASLHPHPFALNIWLRNRLICVNVTQIPHPELNTFYVSKSPIGTFLIIHIPLTSTFDLLFSH